MNKAVARPQIIAHRGASGAYPENTLPAFLAAMDAGVDWLELDVVRAGDGTIVVSHDVTVDRCTDGHGRIRNLPLEAIKALDAGSWFDPKFAGVRIPTLDEVINLMANTTVGLCIEIKGETEEEFIQTALAAAAIAQTRGHYVIESFNASCLRAVKERYPAALTGFDLDPETYDARESIHEFIQPAIHSLADIVNQHQRILTREVVAAIHEHGRQVWTWSINESSELRRVMALGVDGVVTNYPTRLVAALEGRDM